MSNDKNNLWGEVPKNAKPRIEAKKSSEHKFDKKWFFAILLVMIALASAILVNDAHKNNVITSTGAQDIDNGDLKINWDRYTAIDIELSKDLTIANSGVYHLTGSLSDNGILDLGILDLRLLGSTLLGLECSL